MEHKNHENGRIIHFSICHSNVSYSQYCLLVSMKLLLLFSFVLLEGYYQLQQETCFLYSCKFPCVGDEQKDLVHTVMMYHKNDFTVRLSA